MSWVTFCGFRVKLPPNCYLSDQSKVEAKPLSALPKNASELAGLIFTIICLMMNVKQGSYEYQFFYVFWYNLTRELNLDVKCANTRPQVKNILR